MSDDSTRVLEFDEARQQLAKAHQREAMVLGLLGTGLFILVVYLSMLTGISSSLMEWSRTFGMSPWIHVAVYVVVAYSALSLLALPLRVVGRKSHLRYGLTKQSWVSWTFDRVKVSALGLLFALLTVEALYWTIRNFGQLWWLVLWAISFGFTLIAGYLAPIVFLPLFYRVRKIEDVDLVARVRKLAESAGVDLLGVYEFRSSPKTERGTAALVGLGKTRRMLLSDHILEQYTGDEVEGILAHEFAHHIQRDTGRQVALSAATSLLALYLMEVFVRATVPYFGISDVSAVATLPLFVLFGAIYYTAVNPVTHSLSRLREAKADRLGASLCGKPLALASALVKLHNLNLSDASPPRYLEVLFYTHPAGRRRVSALLDIA